MRMYLGGEWVDRDRKIDVMNPYDDTVIDTVPGAGIEDVDAAIASAERGAVVMAGLSAYERSQVLRRAADLMTGRAEDLARTITLEEGKVLAEGLGEALMPEAHSKQGDLLSRGRPDEVQADAGLLRSVGAG